jgi:uncharacterized protein
VESKLKAKYLFLVVFFSSCLFAQDIGKNGDTLLIGTWLGKIKAMGADLRLVLHFEFKDGKYIGKLDSPDQGAKDIPVSDVEVKSDSIIVHVAVANAFYKGKIVSDSVIIHGAWLQSGMSFPLSLSKVKVVETLNRPQESKPPFPYNEEEVFIENKKAGVTLAGSFTYPKVGNKFPTVIMITGSGPQNRDEELLGHKPFLVIADYLTRNGIAVLRCDDRGSGKSTGKFITTTNSDIVGDVIAQFEYLKTRKEVDKNKIGLIGHSQGGIVAPIAAVENKDISFIVLLAGTGIPGSDLLVEQRKLISIANGEDPKKVERDSQFMRKILNLILSEKDTSVVMKKALLMTDEYIKSLPKEDLKLYDGFKEQTPMLIRQTLQPWFYSILEYDPRPTLEKVKCAVLALNGENDLQVPYKDNLSGIENALKKGGNKNHKIVPLPGLNHLFQPSKTGSPNEYASIETTISPEVLTIMKDWILNLK